MNYQGVDWYWDGGWMKSERKVEVSRFAVGKRTYLRYKHATAEWKGLSSDAM